MGLERFAERASTSHVLNILRCTTRIYIFSHFLIFTCYFSYILGKEVGGRNKKKRNKRST